MRTFTVNERKSARVSIGVSYKMGKVLVGATASIKAEQLTEKEWKQLLAIITKASKTN